ncbi:hypothetical protein GJ496_007972 [Pomphorhynchus laevis]|nr:hypothetical protein GJ496_007972 [Pomphorhynchus laevis]
MDELNDDCNQRDAMLAQMHDITNLSINRCHELLDQANWDLQLAISNHFQQPFDTTTNEEMINNNLNDTDLNRNNQTADLSLRRDSIFYQFFTYPLVTLSRFIFGNNNSFLASSISLSGMSSIVSTSVRIISNIFYIFGQLLWSFVFTEIPNLQSNHHDEIIPSSDPVDDVLNFIAHFSQKYGPNTPHLYHGSFSQVKRMCIQDTCYLLVYIHDTNSQQCEGFCSNILCKADVIDLINRRFIFWASSNDRYESIKILRDENEIGCPFIAVYLPQNGRMTLLMKVSSITNEQAFTNRLENIISNTQFLQAEEIERRNRLTENALIRQEQDASYQRSLEADQEKVRQQEEKRRLETEEIEKKKHEMNDLIEIQKRAKEALDNEKEPDSTELHVVTLSIRLPNGNSLRRRFFKTDNVQLLYNYMRSHHEVPVNFHIYANFPKKLLLEVKRVELSYSPDTIISDIGIDCSQSLLVHDLDA